MEKPSRIWSCRTTRQSSSEKLPSGFMRGLKRSRRSEPSRQMFEVDERGLNMDTAVGSLIALIAIAAALLCGFRWLVRSFSKYRGSRIVTCPETKKPAIVEVDSLHASLTSTVGLPD